MTREELDFIGAMNMCDEISNEAYKKIMCHCEEQEPCREQDDYENEIEDLHNRLDIAEYDKEKLREEVTRLEEKIKALEQEPCEAISRILEQIDKAYAYFESGDTRYGFDICKDIIGGELKKMPTVPPKALEPRWIPVSERLPETNDDVLVTDGADMFVAWYSRKDMWQGWMSSDNNFERNTPIEAWMLLPEPYKAESEE